MVREESTSARKTTYGVQVDPAVTKALRRLLRTMKRMSDLDEIDERGKENPLHGNDRPQYPVLRNGRGELTMLKCVPRHKRGRDDFVRELGWRVSIKERKLWRVLTA